MEYSNFGPNMVLSLGNDFSLISVAVICQHSNASSSSLLLKPLHIHRDTRSDKNDSRRILPDYQSTFRSHRREAQSLLVCDFGHRDLNVQLIHHVLRPYHHQIFYHDLSFHLAFLRYPGRL